MALTKSKRIQSVEGVSRALGVAAATTIHRGALVVRNVGGFAAPGTATTGLVTVGMADESVANDGADGAATVTVKRGTFLLKNDGANPVTVAIVGEDCFIVDDETVSALSTGRSVAGTVFNVDASGVWVTI